MDAEELDLIIAATITPDRLLPNLACEVQSALGARRAVAFDVSAACSGFYYAMDIARHYLEAGGSRRALVIGAETLSRIMDWSDRSTCVLFGDGAGAAVLEADEAEEHAGILSTVLGTDGAGGMVLRCDNRRNHNPYVKGDTALSYVSMNGQEVYKFAVRTVPKVIAGAVEAAGLSMDEIDFSCCIRRTLESSRQWRNACISPMEKISHKSAESMEIFPRRACRFYLIMSIIMV